MAKAPGIDDGYAPGHVRVGTDHRGQRGVVPAAGSGGAVPRWATGATRAGRGGELAHPAPGFLHAVERGDRWAVVVQDGQGIPRVSPRVGWPRWNPRGDRDLCGAARSTVFSDENSFVEIDTFADYNIAKNIVGNIVP